jgi:EAL domain-containing protein (putative c-di-GMP-specific phosphodiesterase class I)
MHAEGRAGRVLGRDGAAPPPEDVAESAFALLAQPVLPLGGTPADPRFELLARLGTADGAHVGYDKWTGDFGGAALARRIDAMVVERALSRLAACRDVLREHPASFWMNLSAASLADATFWRELEERLRAARLPAGTVGFEFPESAIDGQAERIAPMMQRLRSDGVGFALDNFGRHGGSLASLRALPLSAVKIDGALCRDLLHDPRARSTFLAVTKLAQAFGLDAIATHVETDAARARAAELGADFGQGFLIGRPAPFDEILHDLPLYSCFSTSTGLFDAVPRRTAAAAG